MSEADARKMLKGIIDRDAEQFETVHFLTALSKPKQKRRMFAGTELHPLQIGSIAEYLVSVDLMQRGLYVYKAMCPSSASDLMISDMNGDFRMRVEVKSAEYRADRTAFVDVARNCGKFDILAIVLKDGAIHYRGHDEIGRSRILLSNIDHQLTSAGDDIFKNKGILKEACE